LGIQICSSYPINYTSNDLTREFGGNFGINYCFGLIQQTSIETGIIIDLYGRKNISKYNSFYQIYEDASFTRLSIFVPFLVKYKFVTSKIDLKTGLYLAGKNLKTFTDYSGIDPENNSQYGGFNSKKFTFDLVLGIDYKLVEKIFIILNYQTPININSNYGLLSIGVKYIIVSR
jgi:hypothetical protein